MAPGKNQHIMGTVYWDPSKGVMEEGFNGAEGGGAHPSMGVLVHEMGHAALYNEFGGASKLERQNTFADEEQMIINRLETPTLTKLGFGHRSGHNTWPSRSEMLEKDFRGMQIAKRPFVGSYFIHSPSPISLDQ